MQMPTDLDAIRTAFNRHSVSLFLEMGAYESLWLQKEAAFRSLAKKFAQHPGSVPSDFAPHSEALQKANFVRQQFENAGIRRVGVCFYGTAEYPEKLRDAAHPAELFYYQGCWELAHSRSIAAIGTRKPSRQALSKLEALGGSWWQMTSPLFLGRRRAIDRSLLKRRLRTELNTERLSPPRFCQLRIVWFFGRLFSSTHLQSHAAFRVLNEWFSR